MIRTAMAAAMLLSAAACGRPPERPAEPSPTPSTQAACNDIVINPGVSVSPTVSAATAPVEPALLGGAIPPGTYDLTRVEQRGSAPEWLDQRWMSVRAAENEAGQTLDFVVARGAATASAERFAGRVEEGPQPSLVYTCGRTGQAALSFAAMGNELHLLLPAEGGAGQTLYVFVRRTVQ